ncbi:MAG: DUF2442 domain-containing protein [Clostridia bacterium]|nr:DUF2442 domain-containing protein [Clostridia bacterium]
MDDTPDIVQVIPHEDYTVSIYFGDGKTVKYDVNPKLGKGVFQRLRDISVFMHNCTIMNDTLAWDIDGTHDSTKCIDIDPDYLYSLEGVEDTLGV